MAPLVIVAGLVMSPGGTVAAPAASPHGYSIAVTDLGPALQELARLSGRNILFSPELVRGRKASNVRDAKGFEAALTALLRGSGVRSEINADGAAVILPAPSAPPPAPMRRVSVASGKVAAPADVIVQAARLDSGPEPDFAGPVLIDVLSRDAVARSASANAAEVLGGISSVNVMMSSLQGDFGGIDIAARAEGQFTAVRGLNSEYNLNLINGVNVAQGLPYNRGVQLSLLPPFGYDHVSVQKVVGAEQDGDAIGGIVDFRTPSAFDFSGPRLSLIVGGQQETRAREYGLNSLGGVTQVEAANRFGPSGALGVYFAAYVSDRHFANSEQTYQAGQFEYRFTDAALNSAPGYDPAHNLLLTSLNIQFTRGEEQRYGYNTALDWRPNNDFSAYFRLTQARSDVAQDIYQIGLQGGRDPTFLDRVPIGGGVFETVSTATQIHAWVETNPERATTSTAQIGGAWTAGPWRLAPNLFYSWGEADRPDHIEASFWDPKTSTVAEGLSLSYAGGYPIPKLTPGILGLIDNIGAQPVHVDGEYRTDQNAEQRLGGKLDLSYVEPNGALQSLQFGAKYVYSRRHSILRDQEGQDDGGEGAWAPGTTLVGTGAAGTVISSVIPGVYPYALPLINSNQLWAVYSARGNLNLPWSPNDYNGNTLKGGEAVAAAYAEAVFHWGALEVMTGLRAEHTDIEDIFWNSVAVADQPPGWSSNTAHFNALLPSLIASYRPQADQVFRAALWTSYTRPPFFQLSAGSRSTTNPDNTVSVIIGNPNLKAVGAINADLSAEWRNRTGDFFSAAAFYKGLSDYIYDAGGNFNTVNAQGVSTVVSLPQNGGDAFVTGLEVEGRRRWAILPAAWGRLWVEGSATWETTGAHLNNPDLKRLERLQNAPALLATLSLTYRQGPFEASLSHRYVSAYIAQYGYWGTTAGGSQINGSAFDEWVQPMQRLDGQTRWNFGGGAAVSLSVQNMLGAVAYRDQIGHTGLVPQTIQGGRVFQATMQFIR